MKIKPSILRETMIERKGPVLLYDNEAIEKNLKKFQSLSSQKDATWSMAVKALARPEVFDLAADYVDGFDISNLNEWNKIKDFVKEHQLIWITNVSLSRELDDLLKEIGPKRILLTLNDENDYQFVRGKGVPYLIRIASSELVEQDASSRFGFSLEGLSNFKNELLKDPNFRGFHTHQGLQDHDANILERMCQSILEHFSDFTAKGYYFNLGGSFQAFSELEILNILDLLKHEFKVHIEPGRAIFKEAGYALVPVDKYLLEGDQLRIFTRLSFINHLKWSKPNFAGILNYSENLEILSPKTLVLEGPTCYEFDKSEILKVNTELAIAVGSLILLENISGYSSEWNSGFNGIEEAEVKFVGRKRRDNP